MKLSGRVFELNCIFLIGVVFLISLQVFLQNAQRRLKDGNDPHSVSVVERSDRSMKGEEQAKNIIGEYVQSPLTDPQEETADNLANEALAARVFPNIRKSFPKRRAPYLRKVKKNKKKRLKQKKNNKEDVKAAWKNNKQKYGTAIKDNFKVAGFLSRKGKLPNLMELETKQEKKNPKEKTKNLAKHFGDHRKIVKKPLGIV